MIAPIAGMFGPLAGGSGTAPPGREFFLPAGSVFGAVWNVNYVGLAAFGICAGVVG